MSSRRLLVIDDEADFRTFVRRVGEKSGFEVELAADARAFKALYKSLDPTVIVLDIVMPETDGIELIQWLGGEGCSARIVIVSGFDPRYSRAAEIFGSTLGSLSITRLSKPVTLADLEAALG